MVDIAEIYKPTPFVGEVSIDLKYLPRQLEWDKTDLSPPYQRGSVWTEDQRLDLMYSLLAGYPIGAVILNDRMNTAWSTDFKVAYAVLHDFMQQRKISPVGAGLIGVGQPGSGDFVAPAVIGYRVP